MAIPKLVMAIFQGRTLCAPTLSRIYVNDFVGDGVLDVPKSVFRQPVTAFFRDACFFFNST